MSEQSPQIESSETDTANDIIHKQAFGVLLREAREQQNYTILEVAEYLRLSEAHISALENSRIDELPGKAFTLGYIRGYTRFLNIGEQAVIDAYLEYYDEDDVPLKNSSKAAHQTVKLNPGIYIVAAIVLIIGLIIWIQMDGGTAELSTLSDEPAVLDQQQLESKPQEERQVVEKQTGKPKPLPLIQTPAVEIDTADNEKFQKKETQIISVNDSDILQIHAKADSWAKIEDAEGKRLFYDTLKAGEDYQFNGKAPFNIFLGNAPAVQLSVNHQDVDLKGHIKSNNVAQISVDETASLQ